MVEVEEEEEDIKTLITDFFFFNLVEHPLMHKSKLNPEKRKAKQKTHHIESFQALVAATKTREAIDINSATQTISL